MSAPVTHIEKPLQQILTFDKLLHNTEGDTATGRGRGERESVQSTLWIAVKTGHLVA